MPQYNIPDMTCGHCVQKIDAAIKRVDTNAKVTTDLPAHNITVHSGLDSERLIQVIREAGFTPSPIAS
jgi:copper chaperone